MRDADRDVDPLDHEVDDAVEQKRAGAHLRVPLEESEEHLRDVERAEHDRRGDDEAPAQRAVCPAHAGGRFVDVGEDALHVGEEARPGFGERHDARGSAKESRREIVLQRRDGARDGGGGAAELSRCGGEASRLRDRDERGEGVEAVHPIIVPDAMIHCYTQAFLRSESEPILGA